MRCWVLRICWMCSRSLASGALLRDSDGGSLQLTRPRRRLSLSRIAGGSLHIQFGARNGMRAMGSWVALAGCGALRACGCARQAGGARDIDAGIAQEVDGIWAVDNHAHPVLAPPE